jgi:hypothetical protein
MPIRWRCLREWRREEWFGRDELPLIRGVERICTGFPAPLRRQAVVVMVSVTVDPLE